MVLSITKARTPACQFATASVPVLSKPKAGVSGTDGLSAMCFLLAGLPMVQSPDKPSKLLGFDMKQDDFVNAWIF